jgi:hypothetical protein
MINHHHPILSHIVYDILILKPHGIAAALPVRQGLTDFRQLGEAEALLFTAGKRLGRQKMSEVPRSWETLSFFGGNT